MLQGLGGAAQGAGNLNDWINNWLQQRNTIANAGPPRPYLTPGQSNIAAMPGYQLQPNLLDRLLGAGITVPYDKSVSGPMPLPGQAAPRGSPLSPALLGGGSKSITYTPPDYTKYVAPPVTLPTPDFSEAKAFEEKGAPTAPEGIGTEE